MTIIELRYGQQVVALHPGVTALTSGSDDQITSLARALAAALAGRSVEELTVVAEPALGSAPPGFEPVVHAEQLAVVAGPAAPATGHAQPARGQAPEEGADDGGLGELRRQLTEAETAFTTAQDALLTARRDADRGAEEAVTSAEGLVAAATARLEQAHSRLREAEARRREMQEQLDRRQKAHERHQAVAAERAAAEAELAALPPPVDPTRVAKALDGLRRLRQVKPRPAPEAVALAERWVRVRAELEALPAPPAPPPWLADPALAALREARTALVRLESGAPPVDVDLDKVAALEAAHREVLDAEEKVLERGSRANRRRLEQAQQAERAALDELGLASYNHFLRDIAPALEQSGREERLAEARAGVADAEAVWAELHGGDLPKGWTDLKVEQAEIRDAARTLLKADVGDDEIEDALRHHLASVVDTTWAEEELNQALAAAGVAAGDHPEEAADRFLAEAPAQSQQRRTVEERFAGLTRELEEAAAGLEAANAEVGDPPPELPGLEEERAAVADAEDGMVAAEAALEAARARALAAREAAAAERDLDAAAAAARRHRDEVRDALQRGEDAARRRQAEAAGEAAARQADAEAGAAAQASSSGPPLEARLWLLGRLAAHHQVGVPLVLAGDLGPLGAAVADLVVQAAGVIQVVLLDPGERAVTALRHHGEQAAVVSI